MRLIDANALKFKNGINEDGILYVPYRDICKAPTIDAEPVRHGHWADKHRCSNCGKEAFLEISNVREKYGYDWAENLVPVGVEYDEEWVETDYCPNCGAKMDEVSE